MDYIGGQYLNRKKHTRHACASEGRLFLPYAASSIIVLTIKIAQINPVDANIKPATLCPHFLNLKNKTPPMIIKKGGLRKTLAIIKLSGAFGSKPPIKRITYLKIANIEKAATE